MHFGTKSYLKNTCNYTAKHANIARGRAGEIAKFPSFVAVETS